MDARKPTPGIETRHSKRCDSRAGGGCDCIPTYQANVWNARERRLVRRSFKMISAAKAWRRDALSAVAHGALESVRRDESRVSELLDELLEGMRAGTVLTRSGTAFRPGTIRTYGYAVEGSWKPAIGHLRLSEVRRADVQVVVDQLRAEGRAAGGIANVLDPLRVLYRRAVRDELVSRDPTENLELPAVRRKPIDVSLLEQPERLLDALPDEDRALWATAFYAGLRRGELRALRWSDVDLERGTISVARGWDDVEGEQPTKTIAGERVVPIVLPLRRELVQQRLRTGRSGRALVFGASENEPFSRTSVWRRARAAWKVAGLSIPTLHTGRHATVSRLIAAGLDIKAVQTYAGHSSAVTTLDVYGHLFPSSIDADRAKLDAHLRARSARD